MTIMTTMITIRIMITMTTIIVTIMIATPKKQNDNNADTRTKY